MRLHRRIRSLPSLGVVEETIELVDLETVSYRTFFFHYEAARQPSLSSKNVSQQDEI
jgi:hypothetical protein